MLHRSSRAHSLAATVTLLVLVIALPTRAAALLEPALHDDAPPASVERDTSDDATKEEPAPQPATSAPPAAPIDRSQPRVIYIKSQADDAAPQPVEQGDQDQQQSGIGRERWRLNLALVHNTLSSDDFNDSKVLVRPTANGGAEGVLLPTLGSATGFLVGLGIGWESRRVGSFGFSTGLTYSATWLSPQSAQTPAPLERALLHELELPLRISVQASGFLRLYLQASYGFGFLALSGVHVSTHGGGGAAFDAKSTLVAGDSLGAGIGSLLRLGDSAFLDAFVGYRALSFSSVDDAKTPEHLNAAGWTLRLGPAFFL
ncbi:MAG: hypothetical protein ABI488_24830 [Polyangiaceae bacterium]